MQDGSVSHFFHRAIKAYNTGTRKRRKIHGDDLGYVRWHKTGRTKPVILNGVQKGCKKIMVLYMSQVRGGKAEKTNWVMHQYQLGTGEDEMEGQYVISKVFFQQQQIKQKEKNEEHSHEGTDATILKVDVVSPKSVTPELSDVERQFPNYDDEKDLTITRTSLPAKHFEMDCLKDKVHTTFEIPDNQDHLASENDAYQMGDAIENQAGEDTNAWDSRSQYLLDSQQLVEAMSLCDEFLPSQSPNRNGVEGREIEDKRRLSDYARLGPENFKRDLEECQALILDPSIIETDTPPDFRLSQLEFGSLESFVPWGGVKEA